MKKPVGMALVLGLTFVLGISSMPAFALPTAYTCQRVSDAQARYLCPALPQVGDHIGILEDEDGIACHATVFAVSPSSPRTGSMGVAYSGENDAGGICVVIAHFLQYIHVGK